MATYLAFYNIIRLGDPVREDSAVVVSEEQVTDSLIPFIKEDREYLGLKDSQGTTLQMLYDADSDYF